MFKFTKPTFTQIVSCLGVVIDGGSLL